jgi:photosystem II stability/assembly factor-like uncharacterized protein
MGAVHFSTPTAGVGLTAGADTCEHRTSGGVVSESVTTVPRLAVTRDGGRHWSVTGAPLPDGVARSPGQTAEQILVTQDAVTVLDGQGRVYATSDAGLSWESPQIRGPVMEIAATADDEFAITTRGLGRSSRTVVERSIDGTGTWERLAVPEPITRAEPPIELTVASAATLIIATDQQPTDDSGRLWVSSDDGTRWSQRREPNWDGHHCASEPTELAAAGAEHWWILCEGGAAAGSSAKGLLETIGAGARWHVVSAVPSLSAPINSSALPVAEPGSAQALEAGSATRLWLPLQNGLSESADGGTRWSMVPNLNPEGEPTSMDVLNARIAWLLAPGVGLWRTTDGGIWTGVGATKLGSAKLMLAAAALNALEHAGRARS